MLDGVDHVVIAVDDLDSAAGALERAVGLACTGGGRHEGLGTANRIAFLADGSYVELIEVEDAQAARNGPIGTATLNAVGRGGGLAAYALNDDKLPITVAPPP
ncbi:MAG: VOC family protein, partial [Chloroflexota bacterium]